MYEELQSITVLNDGQGLHEILNGNIFNINLIKMLTEQEKSIASQIKEQGGTRQHIIEGISQFRAKQPKQEFKTLSQQARESLGKSPEELLGVDSFKEDDKVGEQTLGVQLKERGTSIAKAGEPSPIISETASKTFGDILERVPQTKEAKKKFDAFSLLLNQVPGVEFVKDKLESKIQKQVTQTKVVGNVLGGINDIIGAGIGEFIEYTGLDKPIAKVVKAVVETDEGQKALELLATGKEKAEVLASISPAIAENIKTLGEGLNIFGFGKGGQVIKRTTGNIKDKLPSVSIKNQALAEELVNNTLKFKPNQKKKFRQPNIGGGKSPSEFLFEKGIIKESSTTDDIVKGLEDLASTSKTSKTEALKGLTETFKHKETNQIIDVLLKETSDTPGLESIVNRLNELKAKGQRGEGLTLSEIDEIKRSSDDILNLFSVTGNLKEGTLKKGLSNLRDKTKTFIENEADKLGVDNIKALNKDTQLSVELLKMLDNNLEAGTSTRILSLTDVILGGTATFGGSLGTGAAVILGKKIAESDRFRIAVAKRLATISPDKVQDILKKVETGEPLTAIEKVLVTSAIIQAEADLSTKE